MPLFSLLDLAPICQGGDAAQAFREAAGVARAAEEYGYHRYWLAEHHNIPGVASAATSVVIGHVAAATSTIRVGSGGVMLPNHAPLVIAEHFGTLESLFPGRIDLGLGRAPGGDQMTSRALRRGPGSSGDTFPEDVRELQAYLAPASAHQAVTAVPGAGLRVPLYLLGSSDFSARLAGEMGLPFAFASHFAPGFLLPALALYREHFRPSAQLTQPHAMVGVNVFAAETDDEAARLFTSLQQAFLGILRGRRTSLPPPVDSMDALWNPAEEAQAERMLQCSAVGSPATVRQALERLIELTKADEIVATAQIYDYPARVRSLELAAGVFRELNGSAG